MKISEFVGNKDDQQIRGNFDNAKPTENSSPTEAAPLLLIEA